MDKRVSKQQKKPYEKPRVFSSQAFQVEALVCTLFMVCSTSES